MFGLVSKWQASGQAQSVFTNEHEVSLHTFKYWLYKYRRENESPEGFIRLDEIRTPEICLRYPNGVELLAPSQTPVSVIGELIKIQG